MIKYGLCFCYLLLSSVALSVEHQELHKAYLEALKQQPETEALLTKALNLERQAYELAQDEFKYAYNIGVVYSYLENYKQSQAWMTTALKIAKTDDERAHALSALSNVEVSLARLATRDWQPSVNVSMVLKSGNVELLGREKNSLPKVFSPYRQGQPITDVVGPVASYFDQYDQFAAQHALLFSDTDRRTAQEHYNRGFNKFYNWYKNRYFAALEHEPFVIAFVDNPYQGHQLLKQIYPQSGTLQNSPFFGFFNPKDNFILATVSAGYGTFLHELMHGMLHADFPQIPEWLDEAMASLYERSRWSGGVLMPLPNWRLDNISESTMMDLSQFDAIEEDRVIDYQELSALRMLMLYLESEGKLTAFYHSVKDNQDYRSSAQAIQSLAIDPVDWQAFVRKNVVNYRADLTRGRGQLTNPDDIKFVQSALNQILKTNHTVDGVWGSTSDSQVKAFQKKHDLNVDGIVGKNTLKKIKRVLATLDAL